MSKNLVLLGGFDPTGHAGLLADSRVLDSFKLPHVSVVTALTAQTDSKFIGWEGVSPKIFAKQLQSCGPRVWGVKIGMLGDLQVLPILLRWLKKVKPREVVWDPVLNSSSGGKLISSSKWNASLKGLSEQTTLWTPNLPEAEWILGTPLNSLIKMEQAAQDLYALGKRNGRAVLLKGGHLSRGSQVTDILADRSGVAKFHSVRRRRNPRGTGCTLASALLAYLAQGSSKREAVSKARSWVRRRLFSSPML
jgi:hydroxymethylpyrimidine kinase/phosphomethylpyrimidine kinase